MTDLSILPQTPYSNTKNPLELHLVCVGVLQFWGTLTLRICGMWSTDIESSGCWLNWLKGKWVRKTHGQIVVESCQGCATFISFLDQRIEHPIAAMTYDHSVIYPLAVGQI